MFVSVTSKNLKTGDDCVYKEIVKMNGNFSAFLLILEAYYPIFFQVPNSPVLSPGSTPIPGQNQP